MQDTLTGALFLLAHGSSNPVNSYCLRVAGGYSGVQSLLGLPWSRLLIQNSDPVSLIPDPAAVLLNRAQTQTHASGRGSAMAWDNSSHRIKASGSDVSGGVRDTKWAGFQQAVAS